MERITKLQELQALLTSPSKDGRIAQNLQYYFLGVRGCTCKLGNIINALQNYYNEHKGELL
jgi:hypothetical protein